MAYPFVQSYHDAGLRRGPILGFCVHMAEGGGTVGYLSRPNANGVSVHYVIEYSGRIVQMLREDHMHTSIRIRNLDGSSAIRTGTGTDGYGYAPAQAVLGDWHSTARTLGPNHATVAVEVEGFAAAGPNPAQTVALVRLAADVRARNLATIRGNTGHRDHNVKACPGQLIGWAALGGHGLYASAPPPGGTEMALTKVDPTSGYVTTNAACQAVNVASGTGQNIGPNETYQVICTAELSGQPGVRWFVCASSDQVDFAYLLAFAPADITFWTAPTPPATGTLTTTTAPDGQSVTVTIQQGG